MRKRKAEMVNDSAPIPKRVSRARGPLCPTEPSIRQLISECPRRCKRTSNSNIHPSAKEKRNKEVTICPAAAAFCGPSVTTCAAAAVPSRLRLIVENNVIPFTQASGSPIDYNAERHDDIIVEDDDSMDKSYVDENAFCGNGRLSEPTVCDDIDEDVDVDDDDD
jgi:hypothetical protein